QRGMEVALTKGPIGTQDEFIAWLHVVIRNEATTLARRHGRETPAGDDIQVAVDSRGHEAREPAAVAEWRERYRTLQDAMTSLNEAERVCLLLRTAGVSRAEIGSMTGYTDRKVERSIVRARKRLHAWHLDLATGEKCQKVQDALERVADHEADDRERRMVSRHVRHCGACRATLRARRETNAGITVLVPVAVVGAAAAGLAVPDPSPAMSVVERGTARMAVTVGQAWQAMLDLPTLMSARMGAGAVAITVAGFAGVPLVAKTVGDGQRQATQPVAAQVRTVADAAGISTVGGPGGTGTAPGAPTAPGTSTAPGDPTGGTAAPGSAAQADAVAEMERLRAQAEERRRQGEARARRDRQQREAAARERAAQRAGASSDASGSARGGAPATASSSTPSPSPSAPAATPAAQPQLEFGP
ncbi:MAG: sigma-70 family RNA polymerase sigma factor, partial [Acidobacteria bacterium]|nr:sigma-70 family RNA polymerase sigma factor [Acidobacteriota bacterium]